jgi:hypothetical protein
MSNLKIKWTKQEIRGNLKQRTERNLKLNSISVKHGGPESEPQLKLNVHCTVYVLYMYKITKNPRKICAVIITRN